jgi:hypothetical protein
VIEPRIIGSNTTVREVRSCTIGFADGDGTEALKVNELIVNPEAGAGAKAKSSAFSTSGDAHQLLFVLDHTHWAGVR